MLPNPIPPPWPEHPDDTAVISGNLARLDAEIQAAKGHREPFTLDLVRTWHTNIHAGCTHVPVPEYVGNFRGSSGPYLDTADVGFGRDQTGQVRFLGTPPADVTAAVAKVAVDVQTTLDRFDELILDEASATPSRLNDLVVEIAKHYVEWIRIHPFADGNGRTARVLVNWILARYWQPLVLPGRPVHDRSGLVQATAPALSTPPDYRAITRFLRKRLTDARNAASSTP